MKELEDLDAAVNLGVHVEAFLSGPIGQYIAQRCETERAQLLETLAEVDPEDASAVRAAQSGIRVIDQIQQWLADALIAAQAAHDRIQQMAQED